MSFDNRAVDREAYAHAVGLRRVEGFKEARQALQAQPMAGVPHRDAHALRLERAYARMMRKFVSALTSCLKR